MGTNRAANAQAYGVDRPREVDFDEVINRLRHFVRSGCGWRMLPMHFGAGRWSTAGPRVGARFLFQLALDRERAGREEGPTAGAIDNQSVKAPQAETAGYEAFKKLSAERHLAIESDGRLLMVNITRRHRDSTGWPDAGSPSLLFNGNVRKHRFAIISCWNEESGPPYSCRRSISPARV
ncbi:MAG: transposase [Mesorhizobium sp.]|nr:MAG: transposase [Mesorhizobium sp.]